MQHASDPMKLRREVSLLKRQIAGQAANMPQLERYVIALNNTLSLKENTEPKRRSIAYINGQIASVFSALASANHYKNLLINEQIDETVVKQKCLSDARECIDQAVALNKCILSYLSRLKLPAHISNILTEAMPKDKEIIATYPAVSVDMSGNLRFHLLGYRRIDRYTIATFNSTTKRVYVQPFGRLINLNIIATLEN